MSDTGRPSKRKAGDPTGTKTHHDAAPQFLLRAFVLVTHSPAILKQRQWLELCFDVRDGVLVYRQAACDERACVSIDELPMGKDGKHKWRVREVTSGLCVELRLITNHFVRVESVYTKVGASSEKFNAVAELRYRDNARWYTMSTQNGFLQNTVEVENLKPWFF
jgi:hypothetical protein